MVTQRLDVRDKITINDANQSAALNSGITSTKVSSYDSHLNNSSVHVTTSDKSTWNNKQDKLSFIREEAGGVVIDDGYLITGELMSTSFYVAGPVKINGPLYVDSTPYFTGPVYVENGISISGPVVSNSTIAADSIAADTIESTIYYLGPAALTYIPDSGGGVVKLDNGTFKSYGMETNSLYVNGPAFLSGDLTFDKTSIYVDGPDGLRKGSLLVTPDANDIVIPQTWLNNVTKTGIARTTSEIGPRYIQAVKNFRFTIQPGTSALDLISVANTSGYALVITYNLIFYSDKTYSVRGIIHGLHHNDAFYVGDIIQIYFPKISGWTFPAFNDS